LRAKAIASTFETGLTKFFWFLGLVVRSTMLPTNSRIGVSQLAHS
jgi:hypothetical protein